ncbi:MAG TPA: oligosaccharide flippase family protein [Acidobacteriaceae bacterium]|nr:oligosaccharide flippase family protein [Acidobacteriaceae bacterium]
MAQIELIDQHELAGSEVLRPRAVVGAMAQLGGLQIILAMSGLVRNKVAAIYLKTSGMGEWAQIMAIATTVFAIVQFGMIVGLSRNVAAATDRPDRQRQLSVANTLTLVLALATIAATLLFSVFPGHQDILHHLGISAVQVSVLLVLLVTLAPVEGLRNNFLSFLQGALDIRGVATKRGIAVIVATIASIPLVRAFGIAGACIQFALGSVLLALLLGTRCRQLGYKPLSFGWDTSSARSLTALGGATLFASFSYGVVDVVNRSQLIHYAGISEAGVYQAGYLLSSQVTQIVLGSIGVVSLATISRSVEPALIAQKLKTMYQVVLPVSAIGLGLLGLLAHPALHILFSPQFESSANFLPFLLVGNSLQAACWVAGAPLLGCGWIKTWLTMQLVDAGLRIGVVAFLLPIVGVQAIPIAFFLGQLFLLLTCVIVCSAGMHVRTSAAQFGRIGLSAMIPGFVALISLHPTPAEICVAVCTLAIGGLVLVPRQSLRPAANSVGLALRGCIQFGTRFL